MARLVREGVFESRQSRVSGSRSHERSRSPVYILMGEFGPAFLLFTCHSYKVDVMDGASHGAEPYQCMPICRIELSICFHSRSGTGNGDGCHGHEHDRLLSNVPLAQDRRHHQGYYRQAGMRIAAQAAHRTGSIDPAVGGIPHADTCATLDYLERMVCAGNREPGFAHCGHGHRRIRVRRHWRGRTSGARPWRGRDERRGHGTDRGLRLCYNNIKDNVAKHIATYQASRSHYAGDWQLRPDPHAEAVTGVRTRTDHNGAKL